MASVFSRIMDGLKHSWNIFRDQNYSDGIHSYGGTGFYQSQSRNRSYYSGERSIIGSIYTRLSIDVAALDIRHVRVDDEDRFLEDIRSSLQECLTVKANIDQEARQFRQDIAMTLFETGVAAIVPVEATANPMSTGGFDVKKLRVGEITSWHPEHVTISLYDERSAERKQVTVQKDIVAIVENPLYNVMNEPNSTLKRLIRKLNMLDAVDEQSSSGKLDLIIQLPYVIKSDARRAQAEQRRKDIEFQLKGSQYGIAYADGTERITQLNRPAENNLWKQILDLRDMLYSELGLTPEVMNGTASEAAMINYFNRTTEPVIQAIVEAMKSSFLTKTARSQKQSIKYFRDPFKFVPMQVLADIADKFTRNEIASANDIRQAIGWRPSKDPKANELRNSNMPQPPPSVDAGGNSQNDSNRS